MIARTCRDCGREVRRRGYFCDTCYSRRNRQTPLAERGQAPPIARVRSWFQATYSGPLLDGFGE